VLRGVVVAESVSRVDTVDMPYLALSGRQSYVVSRTAVSECEQASAKMSRRIGPGVGEPSVAILRWFARTLFAVKGRD
jgi:hypothetical protein